jgi:hypothetical protein
LHFIAGVEEAKVPALATLFADMQSEPGLAADAQADQEPATETPAEPGLATEALTDVQSHLTEPELSTGLQPVNVEPTERSGTEQATLSKAADFDQARRKSRDSSLHSGSSINEFRFELSVKQSATEIVGEEVVGLAGGELGIKESRNGAIETVISQFSGSSEVCLLVSTNVVANFDKGCS